MSAPVAQDRKGGGGAARIGLALAGGGPAGAMYEIGALRAVEEAVPGLDLTAAHVYVGVSAGSLVAAALANGMTPADLARAIAQRRPAEPFAPEMFFRPAYREWLHRLVRVPEIAFEAGRSLVQRRSLLRALRHFAAAIPVALYDNEPIRRTIAAALRRRGRTDDFRKLARRLIIVAADLDSGIPIRFGEAGWDHVPISTAIQASTALPGLYPPVVIDGRHCVDGVLLKTVHASVAFEAGADLVLAVNPIVPVDTSAGVRAGVLRPDVLLRRGLPAILSQTFRTLIHSRLRTGFGAYRTRYKHADFVLIEPEGDLYEMFFSNIFSLSSRRAVCELAYQTTRRSLLGRRDELTPLLARHGLALREDALRDPARTVWTGLGLEEQARSATAEYRAPNGLPDRGVAAELDAVLAKMEARLL